MAANQNSVKKTYHLSGMHCAGCAAAIERVLSRRAGVNSASVNFPASTVLIDYDPSVVSPEGLRETVENAGYEMLVGDGDEDDESERLRQQDYDRLKRNAIWAVAFALPVFVLGMLFMHAPYADRAMLVLTAPIMFLFGRSFFVNAWKQLRRLSANMDTLVAVSTGVTFVYSLFTTLYPSYWTSRGLEPHVYYEAAAVIIALVLCGRLMENRATLSASGSIRKLMGLQVKEVTVIGPDGAEKVISIKHIRRGDIVAVKPGDKIAVDGRVVSGESFVDESMITGEPVAIEKTAGGEVFAGTINQLGSFRFRAEKVGSETLLATIISAVREAQGSKAPAQKLADRIAAVFVPVVICIALATFAVWMIAEGSGAFAHALMASVTVLVIACPCALGLATPTAIMVGMGKGAENNILIKNSESLERLHGVDTVLLDKTGTITEGQPRVTRIVWCEGADTEANRQLLLFMERRSEHPLAGPVAARLESEGVSENLSGEFRSVTGEGVEALVDGKRYYAGNERMMDSKEISRRAEIRSAVDGLHNGGNTVSYFAGEDRLLAVIALADSIKPTSAEAVRQLHAQGIGVYLFSGDNDAAAKAVADSVGIEHVYARMLPADKLRLVEDLQREGKTVAVVGDGINDTEAMAQADTGIAMGKGSDIAMDVAQITLLTSDLTLVPKAVMLSRQTVTAIRQNLFWAFIYNVVGIPIAAGVLYPFTGFMLNPMIAAAAMAFSSVSVVANSLRIKYKRL